MSLRDKQEERHELVQKEDIDQNKSELNALEEKAAELQRKVDKAQRDVDEQNDKIANLPAAPLNTKPQQDALQAQIRDLQAQVHARCLYRSAPCQGVLSCPEPLLCLSLQSQPLQRAANGCHAQKGTKLFALLVHATDMNLHQEQVVLSWRSFTTLPVACISERLLQQQGVQVCYNITP